MEYASDSRAVIGIDPLISKEFTSWVEIRPTIGKENIFDDEDARIIFQAGDSKTVLVEQTNGDERFASTHSDAESAACYLGGLHSQKVGMVWSRELHQGLVDALSQKHELLNQQLQETNHLICIRDQLRGDLRDGVFPRTVPSLFLVIANATNVDHFHAMIKVTESDIEVVRYMGDDHAVLWESSYRNYLSYRDGALWQLVTSMSLIDDRKLGGGDIYRLVSRIFAIKKHFNPEYNVPRQEYSWAI